MAAALKQQVGIDPTLEVGGSGEFTVWVDEQKVADKARGAFPSPEDVVAAVRTAMSH